MLALLTTGVPTTVEVAGAPVPVNWGFRHGIVAETLDREGGEAGSRLLLALYGRTGGDGAPELPPEVVADPVGAVGAASAWLGGAWDALPYGREGGGSRGSRRRLFDWDADAALVAADFQRLYGIDLTDPGLRLHWWRFVALLLCAMRTEGSLTGAAVYARSPEPRGSKAEQRKLHAQRARAWALPPTEAEVAEMARARF